MQKYNWFEDYCKAKKGVTKDYKQEWQAHRYLIRDKMFIMHAGDKYGKEIITLKLEPLYGQFLREQYKGDIVAGYYMNKEHWNSVYVDGDVPDDVLRDMADKSYALILGGFSKKIQNEILKG
ncbi:MAG: MmcQ/YjbR family DNA-binding protein [Defluviitaleaceae bacterium]|nr:MmcQ/YjbR family DNA-binding protein [Defluviitaleaceae bacterium]